MNLIASYPKPEPSEILAEYPLSIGQRALWFLQKLSPDNVAYNVVHGAWVHTELDWDAFRRAALRVAARHPALRTTFASVDGSPVQRVHSNLDILLQQEDASTWDRERLDERLAEELFRPFDLDKGPLLRLFAFSQSPHDHLLLLAMHHTITDLWSVALIMYEVGEIYKEEVTGVPANLKAPRGEYRDFVHWQTDLVNSPVGDRLWDYWRERLRGELPVLDLPSDRPRPPVLTDKGGAMTQRLGVELTRKLRALSKAHQVPLYQTCLAAFQVLLYRYTGQEDLLVGFAKAGRTRDMARTIGFFVNPVVLRADLSGNPSFSAYLDRTHRLIEADFQYDTFPFMTLVERLQPKRDPSRSPLYQAAFAWQKTTRLVDSKQMGAFALGEEARGMKLGELAYEPVVMPRRVVQSDLNLWMAETEDEIAATLEYSSALFDEGTAQRMLGHYRTVLQAAAEQPALPVNSLPILTADERRQILVEWSGRPGEQPSDRCAHQLFEEQVRRTPEAPAIFFEGNTLSYAELNRRANRLAHYLRRLGIGPERMAAISMERSPELIVGLLGILKAGGAFVPLDPAYPPERLAFMLTDLAKAEAGEPGAQVLLTQRRLLDRLPPFAGQTVCVDTDWEAISAEPDMDLEILVNPANLAYVIYTSGSTGRPKGTLLRHQGLTNFVSAFGHILALRSDDRMLQFASMSFDASLAEIFLALLSGAALVMAPREVLLSTAGLHQLLRDQAVTVAILPPTVLKILPNENLPDLRRVVSAGEACTIELARRWTAGRRFFNGYGPTEASIGVTCYPVEVLQAEMETVPIGKPIPNMQVFVLDANRQPAPVGVPGELYVGGVGLARGYLNQPELTEERFVPVPEALATELEWAGEGRLYRTGDLVRWRSDGDLEYLGRVDHQVKVRGFRIELGEVEKALESHPGVQEAVTLVREDIPGDPRLVAYVVSKAENHDQPGSREKLSQGALREHMAKTLPDYMIPGAFVLLDALPLTPNGKVDRKALPVPSITRPDLEASFVKPQSELERKIAAVWCEVLSLEKAGVLDNFFDLGGHSLLLAKAHARLQEVLGREFSMMEMFRYPTIRSFAEFLHKAPVGDQAVQKGIVRAEQQKEALARQRARALKNSAALKNRAARQTDAAQKIDAAQKTDAARRSR